MDKKMEENFIGILKAELIPALGCTEPIAVAYAFAKARETLGEFPDRIEISCSGNIIKNVKGVVVPNSGGLKGINVAAVLGVVGGNATRELEVLQEITQEHIEQAKQLLQTDYFSCKLMEGVESLYIQAKVFAGEHNASVTIINRHTFIAEIIKDDQVIYQSNYTSESTATVDRSQLTLENILEFADTVDTDLVKEILDRQIEMNTKVSEAGLHNGYGAQVGHTLLETYGDNLETRARAKAAAGSDARMNGCSLPVVINSGSGNQGMTVSLPVIEYARELKVSQEKMYRALIVSNLLSIHLKYYIGSLSAFCGAVTAACGTGAAITYLSGGNYDQIAQTITNAIANVGGIVCDGAKSSCAAKIASALDAAILAHHMSIEGRGFQPGEGLVQSNIEDTIMSMGHVGRVGMKETDIEILNIMIAENKNKIYA